MSATSIKKGPINLAALVFSPPSPSKSPALIIVHPGGGVKEQTASTYARGLAAAGFTTLTYDAEYQGESGGEPHFLEDPASRIRDISAAVNHLQKLPDVEPNKIGLVGICAGGGYAVAAAIADHRLGAVATVSCVNIGDSARLGWAGDDNPSKHVATLQNVADQITTDNMAGTDPTSAPYVAAQPGSDTPADLREAADYYLTPRAQHARATNTMLLQSVPRIMTFDAFYLADIFLKQPLLLIAGDKAGSLWHTEKLDQLVGGATKKVIVPGATHIDFYDKDPVQPAIDEIASFMKANLG
ncbi:hypothetical protein CDD82_6951 [Ophiocordyceps australis]|uniref:Dienelactone hydrolase domain-containing protein n=1 Tax=Ophiocordyceps australis TaxID=1399860 RepID=A0A2C5YSN9_9HYPO|nr:hypothetical protein CDD82_6951 [Ophiocordyceps australis]